jgi:hypothetical protein
MRVLAYFGVLAAGLLVAVMFFDPFFMPKVSTVIPPLPSATDTTSPDDDQPTSAGNDDAVLPTVRDSARHNTIEDCEAVRDPGTHLTEEEWRRTCERTLQAPHL